MAWNVTTRGTPQEIQDKLALVANVPAQVKDMLPGLLGLLDPKRMLSVWTVGNVTDAGTGSMMVQVETVLQDVLSVETTTP